jgi:hypothetical protein
MPPAEIDSLREKLDKLALSGAKVLPFKGRPVMDRAFFPGGNGLFDGSKGTLPIGGTLILGSNFGCIADFIDETGGLIRRDETGSSATWRGLREILKQTPVRLEDCFFSNAFPYLHYGTSNLTKDLIPIWLRDELLMKDCVGFFHETLSTVRPKLIVALGTGTPAFLSRIWPKELGAWAGRSIASMDQIPSSSVPFAGGTCICTAITHPSDRRNAGLRRQPYSGREGEVKLITEAAHQAGIGVKH